MGISFDATNQQFHLYNDRISYIMKVLRDGHLGQLYFGARLPEDRDYGHFVHTDYYRPTSAYVFDNEYGFSREHLRQEYPSGGYYDDQLLQLSGHAWLLLVRKYHLRSYLA